MDSLVILYSFGAPYGTWVGQDELQKAFWIKFGRIGGKFWEEFGRVWEKFGSGFGFSKIKLLRHMVVSCAICAPPAASHFATGTPALPRYTRSVAMRGGSLECAACWITRLVLSLGMIFCG